MHVFGLAFADQPLDDGSRSQNIRHLGEMGVGLQKSRRLGLLEKRTRIKHPFAQFRTPIEIRFREPKRIRDRELLSEDGVLVRVNDVKIANSALWQIAARRLMLSAKLA